MFFLDILRTLLKDIHVPDAFSARCIPANLYYIYNTRKETVII